MAEGIPLINPDDYDDEGFPGGVSNAWNYKLLYEAYQALQKLDDVITAIEGISLAPGATSLRNYVFEITDTSTIALNGPYDTIDEEQVGLPYTGFILKADNNVESFIFYPKGMEAGFTINAGFAVRFDVSDSEGVYPGSVAGISGNTFNVELIYFVVADWAEEIAPPLP